MECRILAGRRPQTRHAGRCDEAARARVRVRVRETGGPVRVDAVPDSLPARYLGQVASNRMTLRMAVGADTLGPFDLPLGATPQLYRCL